MANFPHEIDTSPDREPEPTKSTMETSDTEAAVFKTKNEVVVSSLIIYCFRIFPYLISF